ncbi:hypothetical protein M433DRAFT_144750 [Acidomyces richmondensis BFW]|nr:MAG: hypothetical protein FE78DRAFT_77356 [Acidomyces sp. 'richmondensis']KYG44610.1 hypothetical protein M433DRAFT_144750 [Acidomyces richmondensis BFW]
MEQHGTHAAHDSAMSYGGTDEAVKIRELEAEVQTLAERANSASQRFADYENEIRVLQAQLRQQQQQQRKDTVVEKQPADEVAPLPTPQGISRFGSFMHARKVSPINSAAQTPSAREKELEASLVKEQTARIAAEKKVKEVSAEIEELSSDLFQQANEMVAAERKVNAMLKQKIDTLERQALEFSNTSGEKSLREENAKLKERIKVLEQRDVDRRRRLERLEAANKRIERVRSILIPR